MEHKSYETELPGGYTAVYTVDAKNKKTAILLNAAALHLFYRNTLPWGSVLAWLLFFLQAAVWAFLFLLGAVVILRLLTLLGDAFSDRRVPAGKADQVQQGGKESLGEWVSRHTGGG